MKRFFIVCILTFAFVLPFKVDAANLKNTYSENLKECVDSVYGVLPSYDNNNNMDGYLFLYTENGDAKLLKKNLENKTIFDKDFSETEITDANVVAKSDGIWVTRYNGDNVVFEKQYSTSYRDYLVNYFNSFDDEGVRDGYIILFITRDDYLELKTGYMMIKINLDGDILWKRNINDYPIGNGRGLYVFMNGYSASLNYDNTKIWKYAGGGIMWESNTNLEKNLSASLSYSKEGEIDGLLIVGYSNENGNSYGTIIKYDLGGDEVFRSVYNSEIIYTDVMTSKDVNGLYDGYLVTGITGDNKNKIIRYDFSGNIVWEDDYSDVGVGNYNIIESYDAGGKFDGYLLYSKISGSSSCSGVNLVKYSYKNYLIEKEETAEGTITSDVDSAYPGEVVKVSVVVKDGYTLARIIVKDENGKEIEVNSDGTFIMPEGKVTVSAIYKRLSNPDTVSAAYMVLGVVLLIAVGSLIVVKQKNKENI